MALEKSRPRAIVGRRARSSAGTVGQRGEACGKDRGAARAHGAAAAGAVRGARAAQGGREGGACGAAVRCTLRGRACGEAAEDGGVHSTLAPICLMRWRLGARLRCIVWICYMPRLHMWVQPGR
jgi:hypothetical protein